MKDKKKHNILITMFFIIGLNNCLMESNWFSFQTYGKRFLRLFKNLIYKFDCPLNNINIIFFTLNYITFKTREKLVINSNRKHLLLMKCGCEFFHIFHSSYIQVWLIGKNINVSSLYFIKIIIFSYKIHLTNYDEE